MLVDAWTTLLLRSAGAAAHSPLSREQFFVPCRHHPVRSIEMASRGFAGALRFLYRIDAEDLLRHLLIAGIVSGRIQEPQYSVWCCLSYVVRLSDHGTSSWIAGFVPTFMAVRYSIIISVGYSFDRLAKADSNHSPKRQSLISPQMSRRGRASGQLQYSAAQPGSTAANPRVPSVWTACARGAANLQRCRDERNS